jgi:hypothetical protein
VNPLEKKITEWVASLKKSQDRLIYFYGGFRGRPDRFELRRVGVAIPLDAMTTDPKDETPCAMGVLQKAMREDRAFVYGKTVWSPFHNQRCWRGVFQRETKL